MNPTWKSWITQYYDGVLSLGEFWHNIVPCLDSSNVNDAMDMLDPEVREYIRESAMKANPEFVEISSHWPQGPTSHEVRQGIISLKQYFCLQESRLSNGPSVSH